MNKLQINKLLFEAPQCFVHL